MKKFYLFALVATLFASCATDATQDTAVGIETPETLTVSFEEPDSRIQLQENKTVWNEGDIVSVFYRSNANQKWQYQGETGERNGTLKRVANAEATQELSNIVVVYPYNENYYINPRTCNVQASLPATQTYLADSYGLNGNIMVSQSEYNQIALKSVCGWLKLQLTGNGEVVKSITLKGNNGEQVAGEVYINSADATCTLAAESGASNDDSVAGGNLVFDDTILTEVTLDCGEGITLGAEVTAFYIALPPQTFENGLTVTFANTDGAAFEKSTDKAVVIERNTIQPMTAFGAEFPEPVQQNNEIWYTSSNGNIVTPYASNVFGVNVVSNTYENGKGVIKFDGDVTSIGDYAFSNCTSLTSVSIPDSIISIGMNAFNGCKSLASVYISDLSAWCNIDFANNTATPMCYQARLYLNGVEVTEVVIPSDIAHIKNYTFAGMNLTNITIPDTIKTIGDGAFLNCKSLTSVTIPDSVTSIGKNAFGNCTSVTSVVVGSGVTSIGSTAFRACTGELTVNSNIIPTNNSINGAFYYSAFTKVTLGENVTSIGGNAFYECSTITSVDCKSGISGWCKMNFSDDYSNPLRVGNGADLYFDGVKATDIVIPSDITEIRKDLFWGCTSITSVTIPNSITKIGNGAFSNCTALNRVNIDNLSDWCKIEFSSITANPMINSNARPYINDMVVAELTIPSDITAIKNYAFYGWKSLANITIPNNVTTIGDYAFGYCKSLTNITIPDRVTSIGKNAFYNCSATENITLGSGITSVGYNAFYGCTGTLTIHCNVPAGEEDDDDVDSCMKGCAFTTVNIIGQTKTISISEYAFARTNIENLNIIGNIGTIEQNAFSGCKKLTTVNIDAAVLIGKYSFMGCSALIKVALGTGVSSIGQQAFYDCGNLGQVTCESTTPPTGGSAMFDYNASYRKIYVPRNSVSAYKSAGFWNSYASYIEGYDL